MKKIFSNISMVCHIWAQQNQPSGETGNRNVWFEGKTIYSYGRHFPIATFLDGNTVLFNADGYSVSTSNHKSEVASAIRHLHKIATDTAIIKFVTDAYDRDSKNFRKALSGYVASHLSKVIVKKAESAAKRRGAGLKNRDIQEANDAYENALQLLTFFKAKMPVEVTKKLETLRGDAKAVLEANAKEIARYNKKREREAKIAQAKREELAREAAALWINDEELSYDQRHALSAVTTVYLRVVGDRIETSQRAEFPVKHGKLALKTILKCREGKTEWHTNGHRLPLGHFKIDSIDACGNVTAGCHKVAWGEVERIAKQLNLI